MGHRSLKVTAGLRSREGPELQRLSQKPATWAGSQPEQLPIIGFRVGFCVRFHLTKGKAPKSATTLDRKWHGIVRLLSHAFSPPSLSRIPVILARPMSTVNLSPLWKPLAVIRERWCMPKGQGQSTSRDSRGLWKSKQGRELMGNTRPCEELLLLKNRAKATCKLKWCCSKLTVVQKGAWGLLKT